MNRISGAAMIGIVCAAAGFRMADRLKRRKDFITSFITALTVMQTEIEFGKYELKEIFKKFYGIRALCGFFESCAEYMGEKGVRRSWSLSAEMVRDKAGLKKQDIESIISLGSELGMSDVGGQKKSIGRCIELLKNNACDADREYTRMARVYRGCGLLAGAFVVIMAI